MLYFPLYVHAITIGPPPIPPPGRTHHHEAEPRHLNWLARVLLGTMSSQTQASMLTKIRNTLTSTFSTFQVHIRKIREILAGFAVDTGRSVHIQILASDAVDGLRAPLFPRALRFVSIFVTW